MKNLGKEVIVAAEKRISKPFRHHFRPVNSCEGGELTVDSCMEIGMDDAGGYDCSGLVIASLCDILQIKPAQWPRDYRHLNQLKIKAKKIRPKLGDIIFFDPHLSDKNHFAGHMGVLVTGETVVHANGESKKVERGIPSGNFTQITILPVEDMAGLVDL